MQSELEWTHSQNGYYTADTKKVAYIAIPHPNGIEIDWKFHTSTKWQLGENCLVVGTLDEAKHWCEMHAAVGV